MFKFKKVASLIASGVMMGSTVALAAAATFPAPFVGTSGNDVAIIYGTNQQGATDLVAALSIADTLNSRVVGVSATTGTSTSVSGEAISLASGSDYIYLNDELNENVQTLTKDELPTILADGTFTDDDGNDFDYEQTITVDSGATFAFSNSGNDLDDPALLIALPSGTIGATGTKVYTSTITFDEAVNLTASASEGEEMMVLGKRYTVGTATDSDTLILLGGSESTVIEIGETASVTVGEGDDAETFDVTLNGISDATTPSASITVNGETKTFTEGQTKSFASGDVDVFVKTVFRTGDNVGNVEVQVGANKLTLESGDEVKLGADEESVDGTLVTITGTVGAMTVLTVGVAAPDNDGDHMLVGDMMTDPVFGSFNVKFQSIENGPMITNKVDTSTTRGMLSIEKGGNRELLISATDASGNDANSLPFAYQNDSTDDNGERVHLFEGANMTVDDYIVLNSGDNEYFVQLKTLRITSGGATDDDVILRDLFTDTDYKKENANFSGSGQTLSIGGQSFTIVQLNATAISIRSSDFSTNQAIYPYIEVVNGEDHRFAITDKINIGEVAQAAGTSSDETKLYELPSGNIKFEYTNNSAAWTYTINGGTETTGSALEDTYTVGSVDYVFNLSHTSNSSLVVNWVAVETSQSSTGDVEYDAPALLFVEDEDKSESTTSTKNAVLLKSTDTGTYSTVSSPVFTGTSDSSSFDDTDFTGYITNFGTYVLHDSSDDNQDFASLTYPKTPMYANVFFAESDAVITGGDNGGTPGTTVGIPITDSEASSASYAGKNWIVVGGSCVNTVAADLLGVNYPTCGADWTATTNVGAGEYLIQTFEHGTGKVATLVAGFNAGDTTNAATYLRTQTGVDVTAGKKYKGTSSTTATLVTETPTA